MEVEKAIERRIGGQPALGEEKRERVWLNSGPAFATDAWPVELCSDQRRRNRGFGRTNPAGAEPGWRMAVAVLQAVKSESDLGGDAGDPLKFRADVWTAVLVDLDRVDQSVIERWCRLKCAVDAAAWIEFGLQVVMWAYMRQQDGEVLLVLGIAVVAASAGRYRPQIGGVRSLKQRFRGHMVTGQSRLVAVDAKKLSRATYISGVVSERQDELAWVVARGWQEAPDGCQSGVLDREFRYP